jgi:hypothetical protein
MPVVSRLIYEVVKWRGLKWEVEQKQNSVAYAAKLVWSATSATLIFVDVRKRTAPDQAQRNFGEAAAGSENARRFLLERHVKECPMRFGVVAIEEVPGASSMVRLHKAAFYPQM